MKNNFVSAKKYDFDFRPQSYFEPEDPIQELLVCIKGENRRMWLKKLMVSEETNSYAFDFVFCEQVSEKERAILGLIHPTFMGGEYLPDRDINQVEIARIVLKSVTQDVLSLRAKQHSGVITYQLVDEYEFEYVLTPNQSTQPLSFGELILMFSSVRDETNNRQSIPAMFREFFELEFCNEEDIRDYGKFVGFESEFYPQLNGYYKDEASVWCEEQINRLREERTEGGMNNA